MSRCCWRGGWSAPAEVLVGADRYEAGMLAAEEVPGDEDVGVSAG